MCAKILVPLHQQKKEIKRKGQRKNRKSITQMLIDSY